MRDLTCQGYLPVTLLDLRIIPVFWIVKSYSGRIRSIPQKCGVWSVIPNASAIKYSSQEILWLVIIPFTLNAKPTWIITDPKCPSEDEIPGVYEYSEGTARRGHLCGHLHFMEDRFQSMITSLGYLLAQTCSCCPIEPWSFVPHLITFTFPTSCPKHMRRTRPDLAVETKMFRWMGRRKCL